MTALQVLQVHASHNRERDALCMVGHKRKRVLGRVGRAVDAAARGFARLSRVGAARVAAARAAAVRAVGTADMEATAALTADSATRYG